MKDERCVIKVPILISRLSHVKLFILILHSSNERRVEISISMSRKKLLGLLMVPLAVVAVGGGAVVFASHPANAQASQTEQEAADKSEPGDTPDKPGQADTQDHNDQNGQKEQNEQNEQGGQKDAETND